MSPIGVPGWICPTLNIIGGLRPTLSLTDVQLREKIGLLEFYLERRYKR
jgi:hypothetical protein